MAFRITGLPAAGFVPLYGLADAALAALGVQRSIVTTANCTPDRIELRDAAPGETVLLLNYLHQPAASPFRASHAIYVREGATDTCSMEDGLPPMLTRRLLSLRAFDADGMMVAADVAEGHAAAPLIERLLSDPATAYLHVHMAKQGCYAARIDRIDTGRLVSDS